MSYIFPLYTQRQASTVSLEDCLDRRGFCFNVANPTHLPVVPGHDFVGHVVICGSEVDSIKAGDRVAGIVRNGGNSRFLSVSHTHLVKVPRKVDSAEAAAIVSTYTSAYHALKSVSSDQEPTVFTLENKVVLVVGGMYPISQALIQMCRKAKAKVYATAPEHRHAYLKNVLGAVPLPESSKEWVRAVCGRMDYVFDGVNEDGLVVAAKALKKDGKIMCFGHAALLKEKEIGVFGAPMTARVNKFWSKYVIGATELDIWKVFEHEPETYKVGSKI